MNHPRFLFFFFFFLLHAYQAPAADNGMLVGNVVDAQSGKAVSGATLELLRMDDSAGSRQISIGENGHFELLGIPYGYYSIRLTAIGYQRFVLDSIFLRAERFDFNLGDLKMEPGEASELQNVVVFVEKPLIENKDGTLTYNVGESAMSAGSSTAELLRSMPLINTDPEGKILLKGKEPKILIDEKPVDLNAQQLADLLESLPGGTVERIELMQNPPPEYASEQGGVINIVTKKGRVGFTGKATVSYGTIGAGNAGIQAGYRERNFNLSGNLNLGNSVVRGSSNSDRENIYRDSSNHLLTNSDFENRSLRPNLRLQADFDINKHHQASLVVQSNFNNFDNESLTTYSNVNRFDEIWKQSNRDVKSAGTSLNINPQLSYTYKGNKPGENLKIVTGISTGHFENDRSFYQTFIDPANGYPNGVDSSQTQMTDNKFLNTMTRANYNKPIGTKGFALSVGAGWQSSRNDNGIVSTYLDKTANEWIEAPLLSNAFVFEQQVLHGRAGFTWRFGKGWRMVPYVQAERTHFDFTFKQLPVQSQGYLSWLPGFTLRKDFNKEHNLNFVYRKTIRRPGITELNPAIDYSDPYNLRVGNPLLQPSTAHQFDLNYGYSKGKSYVNASAGFNLVTDIITRIRTLNAEGITVVTYQNIATRREMELAVWGGYSFSKMFRLNLSAGYTYNQYNEADIAKYKYRNGASYFASTNFSLLFSNVFSTDGSFRFSTIADPQGRSRSNLSMNLGVQRKFMDRRLAIAFNITDPFRAQQLRSYTEGPNFRLESNRLSTTRNFRLTFSWQLHSNKGLSSGSGKKKR